MKYSELIEMCIEIRRTWNPIIESLDSHADNFLKKFSDENEKVFIKQVFFGTYRYEEFIKAFNTILFKRYPAETNRNDAPVNGIFIYLVCFRLNELPFEEFKKMVQSQNPVKMNTLFQLLFNIELLNQHVRDEWCKLYDAKYIDDVVIGGISDILPVAADLLASTSLKATGKVSEFVNTLGSNLSDSQNNRKTWKPTTTQPFNLTQPKVTALPEPIKIPKIVKSNPVPDTIYKTNLKEIEETRQKRREDIIEQTKKQYQESKVQRFDFETEKRPTNSEKIKEEEETKIKNDHTYKTYYKPMPAYDHTGDEIKLNVATILKEEVIIKRSRQEEEDYVKQVEMNMRDSSEFENWKKREQDKDQIAQLEHQERRRVEMQLAREAAMKAVEEKTLKNKENVILMKELSKEHQKELEEKVAEEIEHRKQLKDTVVEARVNVEIEKQKKTKEKKKIHDDVKKDKKERWFMKLEEDEVQRQKRQELIRKIREFENRPKDRTKHVDRNETGGLGLLEEMSLAELKERWEQLKQDTKEKTEKKRVENVQKKEDKDIELKAKLAEIQALRQQKAESEKEKREQKLKNLEDEKKRKEEIREKSLLEAHAKITKKKDDKQNELQRIAKELSEIKRKRQYLNADKAILEAQAWKSLEDGAEREIKMRQNVKLLEQEGFESIKLRERKILAGRAVSEVEEKLEALRVYDHTVEVAKKQNVELYKQDREEKIRNHAQIRDFEHAHLDNMAERDPFKTKISAMSLSNAKSTLGGMRSTGIVQREEIILPPSKYSDSFKDFRDPDVIIKEKPERLEFERSY